MFSPTLFRSFQISGLRARLAAGLLTALLASAPPAAAFNHPGLLSSKADLDHIRTQVKAGKQPWKGAYDKLVSDMNKGSNYGGAKAWMTRDPKPHKEFKCTEHGEPGPQTDLWNDGHAAYGHALLYSITEKEEHAKRAIAFFDAWSGTLTSSRGSVLCPSFLFPNLIWAAEIIRYSGAGWPKANQDRFQKMLTGIVWNHIDGVSGNNSNWGAWQIASQISIAVFADDQAKYKTAVERYKKHLVRTIPSPSGKAQETCRDLHHTQMGLAPLAMAAEIAWKQGLDLYSLEGNRLLKGSEYNGILASGGKVDPMPGCKLNDVGKIWYYYYAIQNHYGHRKGVQYHDIIDKLSSGNQTAERTPWLALTHRQSPKGNAPMPTSLEAGRQNGQPAMSPSAGGAALHLPGLTGIADGFAGGDRAGFRSDGRSMRPLRERAETPLR